MRVTALLWFAVAGCTSAAPPANKPSAIAVRGVGCIAMTVGDVQQSTEFFTRVLDFRVAESSPGRTRVALGTECVELDQPPAVRRPVPGDSHSNDLWFQHVAIVVSDLDRAYARLEENHVAHASRAPQTLPAWNPNAGGIRAYYFKDPDGHTLEVIWFPAGKGQPRWHVPTDAVFLGIDHTAIAVSDTAASERFYTAELGLRVAGRSENWGPEQEALNDVVGAHLRITTLRAAEGPGVELLQYLSPKGGRPIPTDTSPNDLVYWRTTMLADVVAPRTLRDPDGHVMEVLPR